MLNLELVLANRSPRLVASATRRSEFAARKVPFWTRDHLRGRSSVPIIAASSAHMVEVALGFEQGLQLRLFKASRSFWEEISGFPAVNASDACDLCNLTDEVHRTC